MTQAILSRTLTLLSLLSSYYHIKTMKVLWETLMNSCILFSLEVCFTEKASSNILSSTHMSGRTFISSLHFTSLDTLQCLDPQALAGWLPKASVRERLEFFQNGCGCLHYGCHSSSGPFQHTGIFGSL